MRTPRKLLLASVAGLTFVLVAVACSDGEEDAERQQPSTGEESVSGAAADTGETGDSADPGTADADSASSDTSDSEAAAEDGHDGVTFSCDFATPCALDQFVQYRDSFVVGFLDGEADHGIIDGATVDNPLCTAPEETRPWSREHPYGLAYRCLPGGDREAAHQMSFAPNTSGYTWTGSALNQVFEDVRRVSFTVNMTTAGARNFWELSVIPADAAWVDAMPCVPDLPCNDFFDYDDIGAVGFANDSQEGSGFSIATPNQPDGHYFDLYNIRRNDAGETVFAECPTSSDDFCFHAAVHEGQIEVRPRFAVVIEDRDDGLWFGQENADGAMYWVTLADQHLPDGPVRVVLKFHGYTPTKDGTGPGYGGNLSASVGGFTWHWDDFTVQARSAVPSMEYYGGIDPDRFVTSPLPGCVAFAQGQRDEENRTISPVISCAADLAGTYDDSYTYGAVPGADEVG